MAMPPVPASGLPVEAALPELRDRLAANEPVALEAPPGAGKSTILPLSLLGERWLRGGRILMLEPRRLAARGVAARMAHLLGEPVGATAGYRVRGEAKCGPRTRIEVVTEGILTRMLQDDPALPGVGLLLFDEQHERSLHTDLGLALALESRGALREDLRIAVLSATLDLPSLLRALPGAATVRAAGRIFPVETRLLGDGAGERPEERAADAAFLALAERPGDVLVFLPGAAEIHRARRRLEERLAAAGGRAAGAPVELHILHGDLPLAAQDRALRPAPAGTRRIVLSTAVAETSLTIAGVTAVVDAGRMRLLRHDPGSGMDRLETVTVTRDAADQRRGRAGRTAPGLCLRLWSETTDRGLPARRDPEILRADLARFALELCAFGAPDPAALALPDPPPAAAYGAALDLLESLAAIDRDRRATPHGRAMLRLPLHPRLAHMALAGRAAGIGPLAARLAALLEERDLFAGTRGDPDMRRRLAALDRAEGAEPVERARRERALESCRAIRRAAGIDGGSDDPDDAGLALALAYPDRIGRRRDGGGGYLLSGGRGALLPPGVPAQDEWIVAAAVDGGETDARIRLLSPLAPALFDGPLAPLVGHAAEIRFDEAAGRVVARRLRRVGAVTLKASPLPDPDPDAVAQALLAGLARAGLAILPLSRDAEQIRHRAAFLARAAPDLAPWPDLSDAALLADLPAFLGPFVSGMTRLEQIKRLDLAEPLLARFPPAARRLFDRLAPTHLAVPSGSRIRLDYGPGEPTLAVKVQEMFGLTETPRVADGRVPVTLHLLSPAGRPVQVTRDLAGFWRATWPEVRRDLRARYPKHAWPEDPFTVPPHRGAKRRG